MKTFLKNAILLAFMVASALADYTQDTCAQCCTDFEGIFCCGEVKAGCECPAPVPKLTRDDWANAVSATEASQIRGDMRGSVRRGSRTYKRIVKRKEMRDDLRCAQYERLEKLEHVKEMKEDKKGRLIDIRNTKIIERVLKFRAKEAKEENKAELEEAREQRFAEKGERENARQGKGPF